MTLLYPLTEELQACTEEEINKAYGLLDEWQDVIERKLTIEDFYNVFPQFSGGESDVIFASWQKAKKVLDE